jgi:hypothetical protein
MAKTVVRTKRVVRRDWTRAEVKELKQHSKIPHWKEPHREGGT